jgi:hypothetical protein
MSRWPQPPTSVEREALTHKAWAEVRRRLALVGGSRLKDRERLLIGTRELVSEAQEHGKQQAAAYDAARRLGKQADWPIVIDGHVITCVSSAANYITRKQHDDADASRKAKGSKAGILPSRPGNRLRGAPKKLRTIAGMIIDAR